MAFRPDPRLCEMLQQSSNHGVLKYFLDALEQHREDIKELVVEGSDTAEELRLKGEARLIKTILELTERSK